MNTELVNYNYYYNNEIFESTLHDNNIFNLCKSIIFLWGLHNIAANMYNYYRKQKLYAKWRCNHLEIITNQTGICTICLEPYNSNLYKTKCNHVFHVLCLQKWINTFQKLEDIKCPNCNNLLHYH